MKPLKNNKAFKDSKEFKNNKAKVIQFISKINKINKIPHSRSSKVQGKTLAQSVFKSHNISS